MANEDNQKSGEEMIAEALEGVVVDDFLDDLDDPIESDTPGDDGGVDDVEDDDDDFEERTTDSDDSDAIARARKAGWRPKDEFNGPPDQWKDYDEFNEVGDRIASRMSSQIDSLKAENAKQTDLIQKLIKAQGAVTRQAQEKALADLKERRTDAIHAGNETAVDDIDAEIAEIRDTTIADDDDAKNDNESEFVPEPETQAWIARNKSWYDASKSENHALMRYAASMEEAEAAADPDATLTEILDRVTERVKARFPKRFPSQGRRRRPAVEGGRRHTHGGGGSVSFAEYPQEVRDLAEYFEKSGTMSKREYLKLLKAEEVR